MPEPYLVVITGSRSLVSRPGAEAAARVILDAQLDASPTLIFAGDADGPDTWAREQARVRDPRPAFFVWSLLGVILEAYASNSARVPEPWASTAERDGPPYSSWPLLRNERMVSTAASAQYEAERVHVVALLDPDSPTQGAVHTVLCALRKNLPITAWLWTGKFYQRVIPDRYKLARHWALDRVPAPSPAPLPPPAPPLGPDANDGEPRYHEND